MVKPTYTIAMAAVLMVAAFAGIALVSDDAYAEEPVEETPVEETPVEVTPVKGTVIYAVGGAQLPVKANGDGTAVLYGPEDVASFYTPAADESFKYWKDNNSETIYQFGATITVPDGGLVLVPGVVKITTATFVSGDATLTIEPGKLVENEIKNKIVEMQTAAEGFKFLGWTSSADKNTDSADVKYYIYDAASDKFVSYDEAKDPYTVGAGVTMTAQFQELYVISWVVDNTIYKGDVSDIKMPTAPTMPNHTFLGWADASGKVVIEPDATAEEISKVIEALTGDTTFTAKFEADRYTISLLVGDKIYGTATATFGVDFVMPALPDDSYAYWATKVVKEVTGEDGTVTTVEEYVEFTSKSVTADMTLYAIAGEAPVPDEKVYVTFNIEGKDPYTYLVSDRLTVPSTDRVGYNFLGWTIEGQDVAMMSTDKVQSDIRAGVYTEDTTFVAVYEVAEPPAPEVPAFYETTTGQVAIVIVVFALLFFGYAVYSNMGGIKDKLFGYTISKKEKKE